MVISTGSRFSPGFALIEQSALDTMTKLGPGPIDFYSEYLDIIRFPSESYQRIFRNYLREKYADNPPDLLMLFYVGNLGIAATLLQQLFPEVPVVVGGFTEEKFATDRLGSLVSGFAQNVDPRDDGIDPSFAARNPAHRHHWRHDGGRSSGPRPDGKGGAIVRRSSGIRLVGQTTPGRDTQVGNLAASRDRTSVYRDVSRRGRGNFYPRARCSIDSRIG
jgi:hypothetical protein